VQRVLRDGAGVEHATVQVEQSGEADCGSAPSHA
jgi:hypothetical protein